MKKISIAFDIDGTLRCNCNDTCRQPNENIEQLVHILSKFKNVEIHLWSGGGADYAYEFARLFDLPVKESNCHSKLNAPKMDIAIDDQHEFSMATLNLIVREK